MYTKKPDGHKDTQTQANIQTNLNEEETSPVLLTMTDKLSY